MFAAITVRPECAKELFAATARRQATAHDGGTALMLAASAGDTELVQILLARGADVSGKYLENRTDSPYIAKDHGYDEIVEMLRQRGVKTIVIAYCRSEVVIAREPGKYRKEP